MCVVVELCCDECVCVYVYVCVWWRCVVMMYVCVVELCCDICVCVCVCMCAWSCVVMYVCAGAVL